MPALPSFVFPVPEDSEQASTFSRKDRPQIQLDTSSEVRRQYTLTVPERKEARPFHSRTVSTPPESPIRRRSQSTSSQAAPNVHGSGVVTPPVTPTSTTHSKADSTSSDFLDTLSTLRRGGSTASASGRMSLDAVTQPGSTEPIIFPYHSIDYQYRTDDEGRKKPIGVGAWSDVYLATPSLPEANDVASIPRGGPVMTPPVTPVHSRESSSRKSRLPSVPPMYAIKVPASTSAKKVLTAEARILSYLSRFPGAEQHIVSYYGQDMRTGALVVKAMDTTLESWIQTNLNSLSDQARPRNLAAIFPSIAVSLIDSLIWMQDKSCIHADIKPSNILVASTSTTPPPQVVYSDFSSTVLTTLDSASTDTPAPMGAGTWEYLDPSLLSSTNPASPSPATDLWSLAITLLFLILGTSPFEAFKHNKFQQREMIKSGSPLQCLTYGDLGIVNLRKMRTLSRDLGFDVVKWFGRVLSKRVDDRIDVATWRAELVCGLGERDAANLKL